MCEEFKDCVECVAYNSGPLADKEQCGGLCPQEIDVVSLYNYSFNLIDENHTFLLLRFPHFHFHKVKIVQEDSTDNGTGGQICRVPGYGGCTFVFKYKLFRGGVGGDMKIYEISAQESRICPEPVNTTGKINNLNYP